MKTWWCWLHLTKSQNIPCIWCFCFIVNTLCSGLVSKLLSQGCSSWKLQITLRNYMVVILNLCTNLTLLCCMCEGFVHRLRLWRLQHVGQEMLILALHGWVSMLSTVLIWRHIALCDSQRVFVIFQMSFAFSWNLNLRYFVRENAYDIHSSAIWV